MLAVKSARAKARTLNFFIFVIAFIFINTISVYAAPSRTTYQARIVKPDGYPLEGANINFKFTILDTSGSCILYAETYSAVNMGSSGGLVSFSLGSGVRTFPVSGSTFEQVFSNTTASLTCDAGGPATYSPAANDTRKIVMQFNDGGGWQTLPAMTINAVPYAMYANDSLKFSGKDVTDFVQVASLPTCGASEAVRFNGAGFSCVAVGGSASVTSGSVVTALGYTPADGASVTTLTSSLASANSVIASVSSTVYSVSGTVSSLQSSVAASFAAITSSQWTTSGTGIFYSGGAVNLQRDTGSTTLKLINAGGGSQYPLIWGAQSSGTLTAMAPSTTNQILFRMLGEGYDGTAYGGRADITIRAEQDFTPAGRGTYIAFGTTASGSAAGNPTERMRISASGTVGIGTTSPVTKLDVAGAIRIGTDATACSAGIAGALRYNAGVVEYCNGTAWSAFGVSGAGILAINGLTSGSQTFAFGSTGTTPNVSSVGTVHTFNFPLASVATTTAGVISYSDYLNFANKQVATSAAIAATLGYTPANSATVNTVSSAVSSLATATAASFSAITSSQWITSGTQIYYSSGNVNIGSASNSTARLTVSANDPATTISTANGSIIMQNSNATSGALNTFMFSNYDGYGNAAISTVQSYSGNQGNKMVLQTKKFGAGSWNTEQLVLDTNGYVGVGTSAPTEMLHIHAAAGVSRSVVRTSWTDSTSYGEWNAYEGSTFMGGMSMFGSTYPVSAYRNAFMLSAANNNLGSIIFRTRTGGTYQERMNINNNGYVGIGTSAPSTALEVSGTFKAKSYTAFGNSAGINQSNLLFQGDNYTSVINLEERVTDTSSKWAAGITSFLQYDPAISSATNVFAGDFESFSKASNNQNIASLNGIYVQASHYGSGAVGSVYGVQAYASNEGSGSVSNVIGLNASGWNLGTGTVARAYGIYIDNNSTGPITNGYGIYIKESAGTNSFALYQHDVTEKNYFGGNTAIGVSTPTSRLHLGAGTTSTAPLKINSGTLTASPQSGTIEYDGNDFYLTDGAGIRRAIATAANGGVLTETSVVSSTSGISLWPATGNSVVVSSTVASTNSTTGALIVNGGAGIAGALNVAGIISGAATIKATGYRANQGAPDAADSSTVGYAFGNDGDTGLFSPGANSAANGILAFYSNNSEKMRITASGSVGIGTASPTAPLHIVYPSSIVKLTLGKDDNSVPESTFLKLDTAGSSNYVAGVAMTSGGNQSVGAAMFRPSSSGGLYFKGQTNFVSATASVTPDLYISASGNIGIATSSPSVVLDVVSGDRGARFSGPSNTGVIINAGASNNPDLLFQQNGIDRWILGHENSGNTFSIRPGIATPIVSIHRSAPGNNLAITSTGYVGIGTAAASTPLHVRSSANYGAVMIGDNGGTSNHHLTHETDGSFGIYTGTFGSGVRQLTITSGGAVGIGTTSPTYKLQVHKTATATPAMMISGGFSGGPRIQTYGLDADPLAYMGLGTDMSGDNYELSIYSSAAAQNGKITFGQYNGASYTERMRVSGAGNLGIATNNPQAKLHVVGDVRIVDGNQAAGRVLASDANGTGAWKQTIIHGTVASVANSSSSNGVHINSGVSITLPPGKWQITGMGITAPSASCRADFGIENSSNNSTVKYTLMPPATGDYQTATVTAYVDIAVTTTYNLYAASRGACTTTIHVDNNLWEITATGVAY